MRNTDFTFADQSTGSLGNSLELPKNEELLLYFQNFYKICRLFIWIIVLENHWTRCSLVLYNVIIPTIPGMENRVGKNLFHR
jgi:hypothetical protein